MKAAFRFTLLRRPPIRPTRRFTASPTASRHQAGNGRQAGRTVQDEVDASQTAKKNGGRHKGPKEQRRVSHGEYQLRQGGAADVQFIAADSKRRTIRLGEVSKKAAETVRGHVEQLNSAKIIPGTSSPMRQRIGWKTSTRCCPPSWPRWGSYTPESGDPSSVHHRVHHQPRGREAGHARDLVTRRTGPCGLLRRRQAGAGNYGGGRGKLQDATGRPETCLHDDPQAAQFAKTFFRAMVKHCDFPMKASLSAIVNFATLLFLSRA